MRRQSWLAACQAWVDLLRWRENAPDVPDFSLHGTTMCVKIVSVCPYFSRHARYDHPSSTGCQIGLNVGSNMIRVMPSSPQYNPIPICSGRCCSSAWLRWCPQSSRLLRVWLAFLTHSHTHLICRQDCRPAPVSPIMSSPPSIPPSLPPPPPFPPSSPPPPASVPAPIT